MSSNFLPRRYREYLGLGLEIAATISIPIFIGYGIDRYLDTTPWGLLIGALLGIVFFFISVFRIARKLDGNEPEKG